MSEIRPCFVALRVRDPEASVRFYRDALGLEVLDRSELLVAFRCGVGVLLIFDPERSGAPGRSVPSHGSTGPGHLAFAAQEDELNSWRNRQPT